MNKDVLGRQVHAAILRTALFCLLVGTGFLAMARFLLPGMPGHVFLARITELLGWGFLLIAAAALFGAWRESSSLEDDFWHLGSRIQPVRRAEELHYDLDHLAGTWSEEEAAAFDTALAEQRRIDPELWG
jgi:nitric oxide reductase large subunit